MRLKSSSRRPTYRCGVLTEGTPPNAMGLGIVGVPYTSTGMGTGEARGPAALRDAGLLAALRESAAVVDYGDVVFPEASPLRDPATGIIAPGVLAEMVNAVQEAVRDVLADGAFPLVIGGECPLLLGCLAAARSERERIGLLYVDGHEDAWAPDASTTGEAADMALGFAIGLTRPRAITGLHALLPLVRPADTVVLGPRDQAELREAGVPSVAAVATLHYDAAVRSAVQRGESGALLESLPGETAGWWFHLDLDVLATEALPAVRYPQQGGLSWNELLLMTSTALQRPGLMGWNVTIYNPDLDPGGDGGVRIVSFLAKMVSYRK